MSRWSAMGGWRSFTEHHLAALRELESFVSNPRERPCPNCAGQVRCYMYVSQRNTSEVVISYTWCGTCKHYAGSTGTRPENFELSDPLASSAPTLEDRMALEADFNSFIGRLDDMWSAGLLPQAMSLRSS